MGGDREDPNVPRPHGKNFPAIVDMFKGDIICTLGQKKKKKKKSYMTSPNPIQKKRLTEQE